MNKEDLKIITLALDEINSTFEEEYCVYDVINYSIKKGVYSYEVKVNVGILYICVVSKEYASLNTAIIALRR